MCVEYFFQKLRLPWENYSAIFGRQGFMAVTDASLVSVVHGVVNSEGISTEISALLLVQKFSENELLELRDCLSKKTLKELWLLAKSVSVKLTGSSRKLDIIDCLIAMGKIGAIQDPSMDDGEVMISYITNEVKGVLQSLLPFESVKDWCKDLYKHSFEFFFDKFGCLSSLQQRQVI